VRWVEDGPPAVVRREPDESHFLRAWRVPGRADGKPFAIEGFLGYAPPAGRRADDGSGWPLWTSAATAGVAALVTGCGLVLLLRRRGEARARRPARERSGELAR
jgi:hypothetical protein